MANSLMLAWFGTTGKMLMFLAGMAIATAALQWDARKHNHRLNLQPVGIFGGIAVMVFMVLQQMTITLQLQQCSTEFQRALNERSQATMQSNLLTADWLSDITTPPPDIAAMSPADPDRREWFAGTLGKYKSSLDRSIEDLKQHPFPPPKCGRE